MPFKGDMRLGGPHDNEAKLNGSSEDFDGVPVAGTVLSREDGIDFLAETNPLVLEGVTYYPQTADFVTYADGLGGEYTGWENHTPKPAGLFHTDSSLTPDVSGPTLEIPVGSISYYPYTGHVLEYYWDGTSSWYSQPIPETVGTLLPSGTPVSGTSNFPEMIELPEGSGNFFTNGRESNYFFDGNYGFYSATVSGSCYLSGTLITDLTDNHLVRVPDEEGAGFYSNGKYDRYTWNGSCGIVATYNQGSYYPYGTLILGTPQLAMKPWNENDTYATGRTQNYIWNGVGGVSVTFTGQYSASGTLIESVPQQTDVQVDGTPDLYFDNGKVTAYRHNGSGGYTSATEGNFFPYGTYIATGNSDDYFWNGTGGYYSQPI